MNEILKRIDSAPDFLTREFAHYLYEHQHPLNRLSHMIGIPIIVGTAVTGLATLNLPLIVAGQALGWSTQLAGHHIEGNRPILTKSLRRGLLIGPAMVLVEAVSVLGMEFRFMADAHKLAFGLNSNFEDLASGSVHGGPFAQLAMVT